MGRKILSLYIILLFLVSAATSFVVGKNTIINDERDHWVMIICGGAEGNPPQGIAGAEPIINSSIHAYKTYKNLGYNDDHIYYLCDGNLSAEVADNVVSKAAVEYAITNWLKNHSDANDDCCIIFNCHGGQRFIQDNRMVNIPYLAVWNDTSKQYEKIFAYELAAWLDPITYDVCTVIIDACYSGSFIKTLSKNNRIIISSSSIIKRAIALENELLFSYFFFNKLDENVSYGKAWEYADKQIIHPQHSELQSFPFFKRIIVKCLMLFQIPRFQNPKIDDNGDGIGHGRTFFADRLPIGGDGHLALETYPS